MNQYLWSVYRRAFDPAAGHVMMMVYASAADLSAAIEVAGAAKWAHHMISSNVRSKDEADIVLPAGWLRLTMWMEAWDG